MLDPEDDSDALPEQEHHIPGAIVQADDIAVLKGCFEEDVYGQALDAMVEFHAQGGTAHVGATLYLLEHLRVQLGMTDDCFSRIHPMRHPPLTFIRYCHTLARGTFNKGSSSRVLSGKLLVARFLSARQKPWPRILRYLEAEHDTISRICLA